MNNTFNLSRLWLLIKKQWFDNAKLYTLSLLAMIGLLIIVFIFWISAHTRHSTFAEEETYIIFFIFLFAMGSVFASSTFNALSDKAKATYWLTVPATHLEKLVCGIFYTVIVFAIVYVLSFLVVQQATFFFLKLDPGNRVEPMKGLWFGAKVLAVIFVAIQSLFVLGSVYFEKFAFIKTLLAGLLIVFLFMLTILFFHHNFLPHNTGMRGLTTVSVYGDHQTKVYRLAPWIEDVFTPLFKYIWAPVLLIAAYFRLKEKEI